jgi:hypothetical protein
VFPSPTGAPLNDWGRVYAHIRGALGQADAAHSERFCLHDVRRAFVTHLAEHFDEGALDRILAHSRSGVAGTYQYARYLNAAPHHGEVGRNPSRPAREQRGQAARWGGIMNARRPAGQLCAIGLFAGSPIAASAFPFTQIRRREPANMPENLPSLTLNSGPFLLNSVPPFLGPLANDEQQPGPSLYDIISDGLFNMYRAGLEEGRKESKTTPQARQDAERLQQLMDNRDLGLDDAGKSLCQDLMREGVHDRTAANRVSQAKKALGGDLATA